MSVESAINLLMTTLQSMSGEYRTAATSLIQSADALLQDLETPEAVNTTFDVDRDSPALTRIPTPPTLENLTNLYLPTIGEIQHIHQISDKFSDAAPTLTRTSSGYITISAGCQEELANINVPPNPPNITALTLHPEAPTITETDSPDLTAPTPVSADPIQSTLPTIPQPVFTPFEGDFIETYQDGLDLTRTEIAAWSTWLADLDERLLPLLYSSENPEDGLGPRLLAILAGTEPAVLDEVTVDPDAPLTAYAWETGSYQQAQQEIRAERYKALIELDGLPASVTGLPDGQRAYANLWAELKTLQADMLAAAKVANTRNEMEIQHVQWALETITKLTDVALDIKAQEMGWRIKGLLAALEAASATVDVALKVLAFKEKELALITRYNQAQITRLDLSVKMELTKIESMKLDIANNKLIGVYNEHQNQLYQLAIGWLELRIKRYQAQMEYLQTDIAWRRLAVEQYGLVVQAYKIQVQAAQADLASYRADIKKDLALTEAEMLKVTLYNAAWTAQAAKVKAGIAKVQAQAADNKSALAAYIATVNAKLDYLRLLQTETKSALAAMIKGYEVEVAEQQMTLANQQLEDQQALHTALVDLNEEQLELQRTLQTHAIYLQQISTQGRIMNHGAATLSGIAKQAYGGMNAVGAMEALEEA